ncbi:MAG: succinate dehydrogenase assembly factor 2 [Alphaproteobacteria bacterium]|nr:succinate dehydrogenase assembly factor 2 [Alphaproteobacteria bacterium SS10]
MTDAQPETVSADEARDIRRRQLRYRSWKRGTKEMDLLMGNFADAYLDGFSDEELDQFEWLLRENDPDLYNWFVGVSQPPADYENPMLARFLAFDYKPDPR